MLYSLNYYLLKLMINYKFIIKDYILKNEQIH